MSRWAWLFVAFVVVPGPVEARTKDASGGRKGEDHHEAKEHSTDPLAEVQILLAESRLDEAEALLSGLGGDEHVLASLFGLLHMKRGDFQAAIVQFRRVLKLKPNQTAIWLYLGQAYYENEQFSESVRALTRGRQVGAGIPSYYRLLAKAELSAGETEAAYGTLLAGIQRFPSRPELQLDRALLLVDAGLFAAALEAASGYLADHAADVNGYALMAEALRSADRPLDAAAVLEDALLEDPVNADLWARLGLAYSSASKQVAAARSFVRAIQFGGAYFFEAAEQFRLAGKTRQALFYNGGVTDVVKGLQQRLVVLLAAEHFERAAALWDPIERAGAWTDSVRYHMAYALVQTGDLERAEQLCQRIAQAGLLPSAAKLLETISSLRTAWIER
jgi:predicted Zn-dependent protease